jgi:predicted Fe-Mo cluster-binding NifX family protein
MKIAVPTKEDDQIDNQCENVKLYTIFCISDDNEILAETILESVNGFGIESTVVHDLAEMGVDVVLVGQIDHFLISEFTSCKIHVICNCEGNVYELIEKYLAA